MTRVLLQIRSDAFDRPGGDTVQLQRTAGALRTLGVDAVISTETEPPLAGFDLVHLFNVTSPLEPYLQALHAKRHGAPIALSTVYWPQDEYERMSGVRRSLRAPLRAAALRALDRVLPAKSATRERLGSRLVEARLGRRGLQRALLEMAGVWLPNARAEHERVAADFGLDRPAVVVPNAVDGAFAAADPAEFVAQTGLRDFVLCVARIEPRKNHLALVRAATAIGRPLVAIGWIASEPYWAQCQRAAGVRLVHIGQSQPSFVASALAAAAVHALPSWYETPGLASLEAALAGCRVVSTDRGTAREYLGDLAHYCDPLSVESIRTAIEAALAAPVPPRLRALVGERYTWEAAAKATAEGYRLLLGRA